MTLFKMSSQGRLSAHNLAKRFAAKKKTMRDYAARRYSSFGSRKQGCPVLLRGRQRPMTLDFGTLIDEVT